MNVQQPIETILACDQGKILEFKENCRSLDRIVKATVAFANTAGGTIVIGVEDETKSVCGLEEPLEDEERLANAFADDIAPTLLPDIQIQSWRDRELILVLVPHSVGPYYMRSEGPHEGVYVRLGSTNRAADSGVVEELRRMARNTSFDEQPCPEISSEAIDFRVASELFAELGRELSTARRRSLGLMVRQDGKTVPSTGPRDPNRKYVLKE